MRDTIQKEDIHIIQMVESGIYEDERGTIEIDFKIKNETKTPDQEGKKRTHNGQGCIELNRL